ncbi:MAG: serpin family protein [Clostridia bacterium]|nr:serpin family protein [Clostridia bacterium]
MKKILLFLMVFSLFLTAACRPAAPADEIEGNPSAGRQPTTIDPDEVPEPNDVQIGSPNGLAPYNGTLSLSENVKNLCKDFPRKEIGYVRDEGYPAAAADFGLRLMQNTAQDGKNTLISPLSAMFALGMTALGAEGNTYVQMEQTLLGKNSAVHLHHSLAAAEQWMSGAEGVNLANAVWLRDQGLTMEKNYLQQATDYYGAAIYAAPFDQTTKTDVNNWVKHYTKGMIPAILDETPKKQEQLYLINALSFESQWISPFTAANVQKGTFTAADGKKQTVDMMRHTEDDYLENQLATGFKKRYLNNYYFVALLPKEGTPEQLLTALNGENWQDLLTSKENSVVHITLPKFHTATNFSLVEPLQSMGIRDAFDPAKADFSAMGNSQAGPLYISKVVQKTVFDLDENGTRAAAATAVGMSGGACVQAPPTEYTVTLDRPFIYAIVSGDNVPLFLGIANSIK